MLVPNTWFGVFGNMDWPVIQVALDGSYGTGPGERMFASGGWFGYEDAWKALAPAWNRLVNAYGIPYFRSNELKKRNDWPEMREHFGSTALRVDFTPSCQCQLNLCCWLEPTQHGRGWCSSP